MQWIEKRFLNKKKKPHFLHNMESGSLVGLATLSSIKNVVGDWEKLMQWAIYDNAEKKKKTKEGFSWVYSNVLISQTMKELCKNIFVADKKLNYYIIRLIRGRLLENESLWKRPCYPPTDNDRFQLSLL